MKLVFRIFLVLLFFALAPHSASAAKWSVYLYLCGSDLETDAGAATADLAEVLEADLPDDVTVVVQTGGAKKWRRFGIPSGSIVRWACRGGRLEKLQTLPQASMGDRATLASFLSYCRDNFPAEHQVLVFWDHGGGSIGGFASDENHGGDTLSLAELRGALESAYGRQPARPPFEIMGFDTCLMSTLDTANTVKRFARCLVGSQEMEPGNGWEYTGWLGALGRNTRMSAPELGRVICDTYMKGCREAGTDDEATLSVTDLSRLDELAAAWNILGMDVVVHAAEDDAVFAKLGRAASRTENYVNSRSSGYTCMMDMGDYARRLEEAGIFSGKSSVKEFREILAKTVPYRVNGRLHHSSGLSCYYPFDSSRSSFRRMLECGPVSSFTLVYGLQHGFLSEKEADRHFNAILETLPDKEGGQQAAAALGAHQQGGGQQPSAVPGVASVIGAVAGGAHPQEQQVPFSGASPQSPVPGVSSVLGAVAGVVPGAQHPAPGAPQQGAGAGSGMFAGIGAAVQQGVQAGSGQSPAGAGQGGIAGLAASANAAAAATLGDLLGHMASGGGGLQLISGVVNQNAQLLLQNIRPLEKPDISSLEDHPVEVVAVNGEPGLEMHLDAGQMKYLESVGCQLAYFNEKDDVIIFLGGDINMDRDWDKGVFRDNFTGTWAALDGHPVFLEVTADLDDLNCYSVPLRINGEPFSLEVAYDFKTEKYVVVGARKVMENGTVDKNLRRLRGGDRITTVLKKLTISGDDEDPADIDGETFTLGGDWKFEDTMLRDGTYAYLFSMKDVQGNEATSALAKLTIDKDGISYEKM